MENHSHPNRIFGRRTLLAGTVGLLAACAPKPIVLDRGAATGIKTVAIPTVGLPSSPTVTVVNGIGKRLSIIGFTTANIVESNRETALAGIIKAQGLDLRAYLTEALTSRLSKDGKTVSGVPADGTRSDFLKTYDPVHADALLDVTVTRYGFSAQTDYDVSPYRAYATAGARLVQVSDRSVLMQGYVSSPGVFDQPDPDSDPSGPVFQFNPFSDITDHPQKAVAALRLALNSLADAIHARLA